MGLREAVSFFCLCAFCQCFLFIYLFSNCCFIHCFYGFLLCIQQLRLLQVLSANSRFTWWKGSLVVLVLVNHCCGQTHKGCSGLPTISGQYLGFLEALSHTQKFFPTLDFESSHRHPCCLSLAEHVTALTPKCLLDPGAIRSPRSLDLPWLWVWKACPTSPNPRLQEIQHHFCRFAGKKR